MIASCRSVLALAVAAFAAVSSWAQTDTVTIIHVNDTHSTLSPISPRGSSLDGKRGGIARAATVIGALRATNPKALFLHAGDLSVGDIFYNVFFGVPEFRILQSLGCRGMAVGNHEWDLTPAALLQSLDSAFVNDGQFPLLSANTILEAPAVQPLKKYIQSYTIEEAGGTRVGIFGLTTPEANVLSSPSPAVIDTNIGRVTAAMVETLKVRGCSLIIALSHLGLHADQMIAAEVPGISAIVGGHDHYGLQSPIHVVNRRTGDTTWIVQANSFYLHVGALRLVRRQSRVHLLDYSLIAIDSTVEKEPATEGLVASLVDEIESRYGPFFTRQIAASSGFFGEVADSLTYAGHHDTPVGNLVSDAFRAMTGTTVSFEAGGSTAQPIVSGPIVADDLFRVVGYGFNMDNGLGYHLVRLDMAGGSLMQGLEFGLSGIELSDEYFLQVSGLKYSYNPHAPVGSRLGAVTIAGSPIDPDRVYSVSANYFAKVYLDYLGIPYTNFHEYRGDTTEFKALTEYVRHLGTISPSSGNRIFSTPDEGSGGERPKKSLLKFDDSGSQGDDESSQSSDERPGIGQHAYRHRGNGARPADGVHSTMPRQLCH